MRTITALLLTVGLTHAADPADFKPLFNGKNFAGWKVPEGDNGHWKVVGGIIDYDARSESKAKDKNLWTEKSYRDFTLQLDWRLKTEPGFPNRVPLIGLDGLTQKGPDGQERKVEIDDVDSGIYLRGSSKAQVNIWLWPIGSGEVYGYRTDAKLPPEVRAGVTPKKPMDRPRGSWNSFEITLKGERLTVVLNGETVIHDAQLPGVPAEGPIALQHHGAWDAKANKWTGPPSLVQFRDIRIKEWK